jgi:hypothetical protein
MAKRAVSRLRRWRLLPDSGTDLTPEEAAHLRRRLLGPAIESSDPASLDAPRHEFIETVGLNIEASQGIYRSEPGMSPAEGPTAYQQSVQLGGSATDPTASAERREGKRKAILDRARLLTVRGAEGAVLTFLAVTVALNAAIVFGALGSAGTALGPAYLLPEGARKEVLDPLSLALQDLSSFAHDASSVAATELEWVTYGVAVRLGFRAAPENLPPWARAYRTQYGRSIDEDAQTNPEEINKWLATWRSGLASGELWARQMAGLE